MLSPKTFAMIAEPPIPELGSVTASALAEVLATQFKLSVIASAPDEEQTPNQWNSASLDQ